MASLGGVRDRARHYGRLAMERYWAARRRRPGFDHLVRAYERYADQRGTQLAAAVTYYAFLSFFPLVAIAFAAVGYLAAFEAPARAYLEQAITGALPGIAPGLGVDQIAGARTGAGIFGAVGLVYVGLAGISAVREALHQIWLKHPSDGPNVVWAKVQDVAIMLAVGVAMLASVALTGTAQAATRWLLSWVHLEGSLAAVAATRLLGPLIAIAVSMLVFLLLFGRLSGTRRPLRLLWRGALLAAVAFEVLKAAGALLISGTLGNPVYASFAVLVGLLVWINIVMRVVLFCAAWTATWLPVPPPYQGTVPVPLVTGRAAAEPVHPAAHPGVEREAPSGGRGAALLRGIGAAARRAALPSALAGAVGYAVWARRRSLRHGRSAR
ncbi:YihY/virulence factor BrkB family protein [Nocardiopsis sediminis]|uniref:YihY/virulence factor BrkB family protein n=1 Tax=Nocardiopsis sediminis TaxID=1778267 RepID=A0ABV8FPW3_9ACTN